MSRLIGTETQQQSSVECWRSIYTWQCRSRLQRSSSVFLEYRLPLPIGQELSSGIGPREQSRPPLVTVLDRRLARAALRI